MALRILLFIILLAVGAALFVAYMFIMMRWLDFSFNDSLLGYIIGDLIVRAYRSARKAEL